LGEVQGNVSDAALWLVGLKAWSSFKAKSLYNKAGQNQSGFLPLYWQIESEVILKTST
jgi:hypothetical protein